EEAFYASERKGDEDDQARAFELAQLAPPPNRKPFALSYRHAAFLSQISPEKGRLEWCLNRMRDTGMLTRAPTAAERARLARRNEPRLPRPLARAARERARAARRTVPRRPREGLGPPTAARSHEVGKAKIRPTR